MATNVKRKKKAEVMSEDGSMTLTGHLKELRNRLIICAVVFVVGVIGFQSAVFCAGAARACVHFPLSQLPVWGCFSVLP